MAEELRDFHTRQPTKTYSCKECGKEHGYFQTEVEKHAAIFASQAPSFFGLRHLHFLRMKGRWYWVESGKSRLCATPRCRKATIKEE